MLKLFLTNFFPYNLYALKPSLKASTLSKRHHAGRIVVKKKKIKSLVIFKEI